MKIYKDFTGPPGSDGLSSGKLGGTVNELSTEAEASKQAVEPVEPVEHSFDPGEASANVELPKDSFVQQVADHLGGKRR